MRSPLKILVIEDSPADYLLLERHLNQHEIPAQMRRIDSDAELDVALQEVWDIVLSDYNVPGMDFRTSMRQIKEKAPNLPVILVSSTIGDEAAVDLLRNGMTDFILKDRLARLPDAIRRAIIEAETKVIEEDLKLAKEKAEVSQHRYEKVFANAFHDSPDPELITEIQTGLIREVNGSFSDVLGYSTEESTGRTAVQIGLWSSEEQYQAFISRAKVDGGVLNSPVEQRSKNGRILTMRVSTTPLELDGAACWLVHLHDITRSQEAERQLRDSHEILRNILEASLDGYFRLDGQGRLLDVNPAYLRQSGYTREALLGMQIRDLEADESDVEIAEHIKRVIDVGSDQFETRHRRKDGSIWNVEASVTYSSSGGGYFTVFSRDITDRKIAEDKLRILYQAVEQSPESIVITDTNAHIVYVNEAFLQTTGFSPDEVIGQNPRILKSGKTPRETYVSMWNALRQGLPWKGEFHNRKKDGSEYIEFAIITPMHQLDGAISNYVAVKEDITEKKRLGEELDYHRHHLEEQVILRTTQLVAARQQADAANQSKSIFLANMSHEIRTPMNAILGLNYLMRRAGATPEQLDKLDKIDNAGRHLLSVINDILDMSKIETGKLLLESSDFHLSAIFDNVISIITDEAQNKGLKIELDVGDIPSWLRGDPMRLRQALLNYASNAIKFTEHGGIAIHARMLEDIDGDVLVRFEVEDTGIGIPPNKIEHIFLPFEQADTSTTRLFGGTGLGLAITRRLAQLMGGEAGVNSTLGVGSTFWFTARLQRGHSAMSALYSPEKENAETQLRLRHGGARLLLAEDSEINREVSVELLQSVGLEVDIAADGLEVVRMAKTNFYDLILMDMQMPNMDGLEATRAIRKLPGWEIKPIIALTANAFADDRRACEEAGMNDFVAKPMEPPILFAAILKWLPPRSVNQEGGSDEGNGHALVTETSSGTVPVVVPTYNDNVIKNTLAQLACVPGINVASGLAALGGKKNLYIDWLNKFVELHTYDMTRLGSSFAAGDHTTALRVAHTLKGAAAVLGAVHLAEIAGDLESKLRTNEAGSIRDVDLLADMDVINSEIAILAAALQLSVTNIPPASPEPMEFENLKLVLTKLDELLAQSDTVAITIFEEHAAALQAVLGIQYEAFASQIKQFDFETARKTLQQLEFVG